jgi:hypothetical protein
MAKLPKKPKKPRASATFKSWQNFDERYKGWLKKCSDIKGAKAKKETLIKKYASKY